MNSMYPLITTLRSKIHRVTVTATDIEYEGSCLIDKQLLLAARIHEYEQIHIYNITNGARFITYAIPSDTEGQIQINGAAAHKAKVGNKLVICTYHQVPFHEVPFPAKVFVDENNEVVAVETTPKVYRG